MHLPSTVLKICLLCQLLLQFTCEAKPPGCAGVVCPEPLVCSFPKSAIFLNNSAVCCPKTVCVCEGTQSRTSSDNNQNRQLESLAKRYTNCTLVDGNLELTHLTSSQIDFTKHIEQVTGYVLISRVYADYIDLSSLQLIRGHKRYMESNIASHCPTKPIARNQTSNQYALYVELCDDASTKPTSYLKELLLPNLTEISAGDVMFNKNSLCNMDKILWKEEIFHDPKNQQFFDQNLHFRPCPNCTQCPRVKVNSTHTIPGPCWGSGSVDKCQIITKSNCTYCGGNTRCNRAGTCCSELCAGGCMLAVDSDAKKYKTCHACRKMNNNGQCVQICPDGTKMNPDSAEIQKENTTFQFARYCVTQCPENVPQTGRYCKRYCEQGTFDYGDNKCTPCKTKNCENICYGLGVNHGPLKNNKWIDASNIKYFNKNCTIIEGSLLFIKLTFKGDQYCKIGQLALDEVRERFQNVREITGYLSVEFWQYQDLCLFKNLQRIRGKELKEQRYALIVYTGSYNLHQLCLNSLTKIDNGVAHIFQNIRLCYANTIDWLPITNASDEFTIAQNQAPSTCSKCNDNCASGCWGPDSTQCQSCKFYEDYTNSDGNFTSKWIPDPKTGLNMPGYNQTNCVTECNFTKGVYATTDMKCYPCHPECKQTCNGPTAFNCTKCKHSILNGGCVPQCPTSHYTDMNGTCVPCHSSCIDGGCQGPEAKYGTLGCKKCHESFDPETLIYTHHGVQCRSCSKHLDPGVCDLGCVSYNKTSDFKCYYPPGEDYTPYIVLACLVFLVIAVVALFFFVRHRTTIKRMRKTIGKTMVGEQVLVENEKTPLTPSGASPNQAQLRIVKENELANGKLLGSGAFGEVHKAVWTPINIQGEKVKIAVAVKTLKTPEEMTAAANNEIMDEAYMMASVDCIYLVRLLGVCMTEHVSLITQLMPLGSLLEYVRDSKNHESIPAGKMLTWCTQIAKGMAYLQEKHLVHRDLAARNVLVKTPNHVKITDFGLAKMLSAKEDTYQAEGGKLPIKWLAIECITERTFSHLSDVWAFGVTVWELLTLGARPYDGIRAVEMLSLLERGERLPQPPSATIDIYMVLIKCWMVDRACRPDFHELVQEFTTMAKDPSRYVVLKNDPGSAAACITSPSPTDEMQFFRKLLEEEELGSDGELMAEEPDQYLLHDNLAHNHSHQLQGNQYTTMVSVNSAGRPLGPEYENQTQVSSSGHRSQHPNGSAGSAETSFIEGPRGQRLFSRNTPSAVFQGSVSSSGTAHGMNRIPEGEEMSGRPPLHDQDDVFSEGGQAKRNAADPSLGNRKDSEETQRYTEDPTNRRAQFRSQSSNQSQGPSSFRYDEEDYLLPSNNSQMPGPSHAPPPQHRPQHAPQRAPISNGGAPAQAMVANQAYVEGNSLAPAKDDRSGYEELSACGKSPVIPRGGGDVDYVNMTEGESLTPTWFENAEYMATDSGIGEDTQSLLSRGNTGGRVNRKASTQSSFDENDEIAFRKSDARNRKKKQQAEEKGALRSGNDPTWSGSSDDEPANNPFRAAIENPEYMGLLQNREGTAQQELHTNI